MIKKVLALIVLFYLVQVTVAAKCKCGWWIGGWPTNRNVTRRACHAMGSYFEESTDTCWIYLSQSHILDMQCARANRNYKLAGCDYRLDQDTEATPVGEEPDENENEPDENEPDENGPDHEATTNQDHGAAAIQDHGAAAIQDHEA